MTPEEILNALQGHANLEQIGIRGLYIPTSTNRIVCAVNKAAARLGISSVNILLHKGGPDTSGYEAYQDCLMLSDKLEELLTDEGLEIVALHELDHKIKGKSLTDKRAEIEFLMRNQTISPEEAVKRAAAFDIEKEIQADSAAADVYGAKATLQTIIKMFAATGDPKKKMGIMDTTSYKTVRGLTEQDFARRLNAVAQGKAKTNDAPTNQRFRHLYQRQLQEHSRNQAMTSRNPG